MPGNENSGKTSKYAKIANVQTILDGSAIEAAAILDRHIYKKKGYTHLKSSVQRACEFVIDHAIGKARQKIEHSGGVLTYGALLKSADNLEKTSPELLIDPSKVGKN